MALPSPEPGLVINYAYLWRDEYLAGREEGRKDRPSVIILAVRREADGATVVTVLPNHPRRAATIRKPRSKSRNASRSTWVSMTEDHGSLSRKAMSLSGLAMICARSREATITPLDSCRLVSSIECSKPLARGERPGGQ